MRELPDLSLVVGKQLGFGESDQADSAGSPDLGDANVTESDVEAQLVRKSKKRKEREEAAAAEEKQPEEASAGGSAGTEKKRARKDPAVVRSSSVEEGELQALEPSGGSNDGAVSNPSLNGDRADDCQEASSKAKKKKKSKKSRRKNAGESPEQEVAPDVEQ